MIKNMNIARKKYITPFIEHIRLDNAISIHLESEPPVGPDETMNKSAFYNDDPLKLKYETS